MTTATEKNLKMKHRSKEITEGPDRAPARSYLWAMGLNQEDMDKPFVNSQPESPALRQRSRFTKRWVSANSISWLSD